MNDGKVDDIFSDPDALNNHHCFSHYALGIDLDCDLDQAATFLLALTTCWQGSIVGFMVDKVLGVESIGRLGIDCHQLFAVTDPQAKAQAISDTGLFAIISSDEQVLRSVSNDIVRVLVL